MHGNHCILRRLSHPLARAFGVALCLSVSVACVGSERARDWGIPFDGVPGPKNSITDVSGILVGSVTLIDGVGPLVVGVGPVRTGVTAVLPTGRVFRPVFAAMQTLNGNGEITGAHWIDESGQLEEPIVLTNTHSVGAAHEGVIRWRREAAYHPKDAGLGWASLPVVAETWDGLLNDIHGLHVRPKHVIEALNSATAGPVDEGSVGGGTGMVCHRFKGGIGTASRLVDGGYSVGVLVQANYGRREDFLIAGVPAGLALADRMPDIRSLEAGYEGGSIVAVVATDAPLLPHQLRRVARRAMLGVHRTGGIGKNSSGDFFLAFSTALIGPADSVSGELATRMLPNEAIDPIFRGTVQAVEEAILNAMVSAETMTGINGNTVYALPREPVRTLLRQHNRLLETNAP